MGKTYTKRYQKNLKKCKKGISTGKSAKNPKKYQKLQETWNFKKKKITEKYLK